MPDNSKRPRFIAEAIEIHGGDFWVKIVGYLQQNWACIQEQVSGQVIVYFFADDSSIFDEMMFPSESEAADGLDRNGFERFASDPSYAEFLRLPRPPFRRSAPWMPIRGIYSSRKYWKD